MSEVKKIATRDSYGNALAQLGTEHPEVVVLDADLAAATKTGTFKKAHPERFIDCGIAESNMIGVAAGLAAVSEQELSSWSRSMMLDISSWTTQSMMRSRQASTM